MTYRVWEKHENRCLDIEGDRVWISPSGNLQVYYQGTCCFVAMNGSWSSVEQDGEPPTYPPMFYPGVI